MQFGRAIVEMLPQKTPNPNTLRQIEHFRPARRLI
jgi:hypothetical protein